MATETDEVPVMTVAPEVDAAEPVIDLSIVSVEVGKAREEISDAPIGSSNISSQFRSATRLSFPVPMMGPTSRESDVDLKTGG
ncbi:unnamed protein product [Linum tenue]|uniref:Uncharacterized protein n=1 Tax=Linum tenue TaxID=586396 RepID=A0AAV0IJG3_9ROSI|nr:unnamed protein product [Linum tenue]